MNRIGIWTLALIAQSPWLFAGAEPSPGLEAQVDAYLAPLLETDNFSGAILIAKGDRVLLRKGYGSAEAERPNQPETPFQLASVSKAFTAAAILALAERGKLSLDDTLDQYIADYPRGDEIAIRHLLIHTSGIPNINLMPEYQALMKAPQTPRTLIPVFKAKPLDHQPGSRYRYSNSNYNLLAFIIEQVSGQSYGDHLEQRIFKPLGMARTGHNDLGLARLPRGAAVGYEPDDAWGVRRSAPLDWSVKTGNGSLFSTVDDLYKWDRGLAQGKLFAQKTLAMMFTDHGSNVGYGWFINQTHGRPHHFINGRSPGFASYLGRYPTDDLCVIVLSNRYISVTTRIGTDLAAMALGLACQPFSIEKKKTSPSTAASLTGRYRFGASFYRPNFTLTVSHRQGDLYTDWGLLMPNGKDRYIQRAYWSSLRFLRGPDGRATGMTFDGYRGERVE